MCSVCSVVKKNGLCSSLKDGTGNADVPRAALRFALGYLILPLWGRDTTTPSCGDCPRFLATEWNNRSQPETPARRSRHVISVRRFEFFQPIAVLAAARYCGAATTYSLLSPKSREPRNTRKDDITVEGFVSVCSVCSVVKKNGICSSLKDGTGNADVPRAALRFALGYLILPLWGRDTTTLSLCWLPLDIAVRQPRIRSYRRRSRRLRPGSVSAQGRSGNCECHDLRDARP